MSISNLLSPNNYNLEVNSVITSEAFSANIHTTDFTLNTLSTTVLTYNNVLIANSNFVSGAYTIPKDGIYTFDGFTCIALTFTSADEMQIGVSLTVNTVPIQNTNIQIISLIGANAFNLSVHYSGNFTAGQVVEFIAQEPESVSLGSTNIASIVAKAGQTIFTGKKGI